MVFIVQAAGVREMAPGAAEVRGLLVHHLHKIFNAPGTVLSQSIGRLISRGQHQTVQAVPHGQLVSRRGGHIGAVGLYIIDRIVREGDHIVHIAIFDDDQSREDLRDTGRVESLVRIFFKKDGPGICIDQDPPICLDAL